MAIKKLFHTANFINKIKSEKVKPNNFINNCYKIKDKYKISLKLNNLILEMKMRMYFIKIIKL